MTCLAESPPREGTQTGVLSPILGTSRALREAVELARRVAASDLPVLLIGPTGCGKELFAQHIHAWSGRRGDLVDLNCAAVPETLIESELFGHAAGAFTGARGTKPGLIETAHGQSFFLDEVVSLSPGLQAKVLRVVENQELRRVGDVTKRRVDVRFLAAAQEDLGQRIERGTFRRDLFHRLAGGVIRIPPLMQRPADIWVLAAHYAGCMGRRLDPTAESVLRAHRWPGNVRELRMVIERAACLVDGPIVTRRSLNHAVRLGSLGAWSSGDGTQSAPPRARAREALRGQPTRLAELIAAHQGSIACTARALSVPRATLQRWLREVGL